jgi:hypothetical protein
MVRTENKAWLAEHDENRRTLEAMLRRQAWMAFVARLELSWYESWRVVLTEAPPSPAISPFKPWLYNWRSYRGR